MEQKYVKRWQVFQDVFYKILNNWHHKHKWRHAKEVINYYSCKFGRDLTGNNCTMPSLDRHKVTLAELCVQLWSLFHITNMTT